MTNMRDQWTPERVAGLEAFLAGYPDDPYANAFLARLRQCQTLDAKRDLILNDLLPALRAAESATMLWEGTEYPTHITFADLVDDYLRREGVIENVPTFEEDSPEEAEDRERLSHLMASEKLLSDQVIEDRGPR